MWFEIDWLPILYIPLAITAIRCTRCVVETIVGGGAGATIVGCRWAHVIERPTLRKHFAIRWCHCKERLRAILKRTNEDTAQDARTAVRTKNFIVMRWWRLLKCADVLGSWTVFDWFQRSAISTSFKPFNGFHLDLDIIVNPNSYSNGVIT